jgi:hypothetical protein
VGFWRDSDGVLIGSGGILVMKNKPRKKHEGDICKTRLNEEEASKTNSNEEEISKTRFNEDGCERGNL